MVGLARGRFAGLNGSLHLRRHARTTRSSGWNRDGLRWKYSYQFDRRATIGSIRDALHAGIYPARAATTVSSVPIATKVTGSPAATPNNMLPPPLDNARAA